MNNSEYYLLLTMSIDFVCISYGFCLELFHKEHYLKWTLPEGHSIRLKLVPASLTQQPNNILRQVVNTQTSLKAFKIILALLSTNTNSSYLYSTMTS